MLDFLGKKRRRIDALREAYSAADEATRAAEAVGDTRLISKRRKARTEALHKLMKAGG